MLINDILEKLFGPKTVQPVRYSRVSKHAQAKTRPHDWREKRKTRRLMAKASRRINRIS